MPDENTGKLPKIIDDHVNNNYAEWVFESHLKLLSWDLWKYIKGPESTPPTIPDLCEETVLEATDADDGQAKKFCLSGNAKEHQQKLKEAAPWMASNNTVLSKIASATPSDQLHLIQDVLPSPRPWDFPPSIDGDVSREDSPMELDEPEGAVSPD
jgi:hypothetical protein